jgi:hypothetical protein
MHPNKRADSVDELHSLPTTLFHSLPTTPFPRPTPERLDEEGVVTSAWVGQTSELGNQYLGTRSDIETQNNHSK